MKHAIATYPCGSWYKGEYNCETNQKEGEGAYFCNHGAFFCGQEKNDEMHSGKYVYADFRERSGVWKDGKDDGVYSFVDSSGTEFEQIWEQGKKVKQTKKN